MYRVTELERTRLFYEALGMEHRRHVDIVKEGVHEATNHFFGFPGQEEELQLVVNHDGRTYTIGDGFGHVMFRTEDLDGTLERLRGLGVELERGPFRAREGGPRVCFLSDPDGYRIALLEAVAE
jgi:lactoylglutathione lyase